MNQMKKNCKCLRVISPSDISEITALPSFRGLISDPATQQFSSMAPRIKKLPRQPKRSNRNWFSGASVQRKTGLPAMARPLAMGLLT